MIKINLMKGDCLERMKEIPDGSVDSIVTDPPYGMDYQSAWRSDKSKRFDKIAGDKKPFVWFLYDAFRVLKDGAGILTFTDWKNAEAWKLALEWAGFSVRSQVIWNREIHGMGDLKGAFAPMHDVIWFATKGAYSHPGKRPRSVISSKRLSGNELVHPTEKPLDLMVELVKSITPEGGTVLDPFMGSGPTGVAATQNGFGFIGIERDDKYFEIAKERIEKA
jgi:DNA modification methylase